MIKTFRGELAEVTKVERKFTSVFKDLKPNAEYELFEKRSGGLGCLIKTELGRREVVQGDYIVRLNNDRIFVLTPIEFTKEFGDIQPSKIERLSFSQASDYIRTREFEYMRLPHWSRDVKVKIMFPQEGSEMTSPYFYVESRHGRVPWKETMIELFSFLWEVHRDGL